MLTIFLGSTGTIVNSDCEGKDILKNDYLEICQVDGKGDGIWNQKRMSVLTRLQRGATGVRR